MARSTGSQATKNSAPLGFEAKLWSSANTLRGNVDPAEYKHVVLGLIFLKYISDAFAHCDFLNQCKNNVPVTPLQVHFLSLFFRQNTPLIQIDGKGYTAGNRRRIEPVLNTQLITFQCKVMVN